MEKVYLIYGNQKTFFSPPPEWRLVTFADQNRHSPRETVEQLTGRALDGPIDSPRLDQLISPSDRVAIAIEDLTRSSPKREILKTIFKELTRIGIPDERVAVIVALGTHRPLSAAEMAAGYGEDIVRRYRVMNHDCRAPDLVPVGRLSTGGRVRINPTYHGATFRMAVGTISPHPTNGFGGGAKAVFPGLSNFEAIREHHLKWTFHQGTALGRIRGNPFHDEVVRMSDAAGLDFLVNTVPAGDDRVYQVVAGRPAAAYLEGVEISRKIISHRFPGKSDLTLISSFPYAEGPQITKPLTPASMVTREGGCIILAADCTGNLPEPFVTRFLSFHREYGEDLEQGVLDHFRNGRLIMDQGAVDLNMALGFTLTIQNRFRIILVSRDISRQQAEAMGYYFAPTLDEAIALSRSFVPARPEVHIIPSGGIFLPELTPS